MNLDLIWRSVIIGFVVATAYADVRWRKIPRNATVAALLGGLAMNWHYGFLAAASVAALIAFCASLGLFSLGAIGGGDVKLVTALAAMLRLEPWARAMEIAIFAGCAIGLIQMIRSRAVGRTLRRTGELLKWLVTHGPKPHPEMHVKNPNAMRSPFALAAAVGTVVVLLIH